MKLKLVKFKKSFTCDVLIFDHIGESWLSKLVPNSASIGYFSTRFYFPILFHKYFLRRLCVILLGRIFARNYDSYHFYLDAVIQSIQPKIIITAADNNAILSKMSKLHSSILFVYVQSALRDLYSFQKNVDLPVYCSFGSIEKKLFADLNIHYQEYLAIGSVKLGMAMSEKNNSSHVHADICFISSHRAEKPYSKKSAISKRIEDIDRLLFLHSIKFARRSNLSVRVLGKAREDKWQKLEMFHYENLAGGFPFEYVRTDNELRKYASYHGLLSSGLSINCGSTLGFEGLSAGKKVLFGATMDMKFIDDWGVSYYYSDMPQLISLQQNSFEHFCCKVKYLRKMSIDEFLEITSPYALQIMNKSTIGKSHELLQQKLEYHLSQNAILDSRMQLT